MDSVKPQSRNGSPPAPASTSKLGWMLSVNTLSQPFLGLKRVTGPPLKAIDSVITRRSRREFPRPTLTILRIWILIRAATFFPKLGTKLCGDLFRLVPDSKAKTVTSRSVGSSLLLVGALIPRALDSTQSQKILALFSTIMCRMDLDLCTDRTRDRARNATRVFRPTKTAVFRH